MSERKIGDPPRDRPEILYLSSNPSSAQEYSAPVDIMTSTSTCFSILALTITNPFTKEKGTSLAGSPTEGIAVHGTYRRGKSTIPNSANLCIYFTPIT